MTYDYRITVTKVIDGDTVQADVDLGFHLTGTQRFRLLWIDTPELRDPDPAVRVKAQAAKTAAQEWVDEHGPHGLRATTVKGDHFGRWLAAIYCPDHPPALSEWLVEHGHAMPYAR